MDYLLDYILYVIMTCEPNVEKVETISNLPAWRFSHGENGMQFIFDAVDVQVFRDVYSMRVAHLTDEEKEIYERFFSLCV